MLPMGALTPNGGKSLSNTCKSVAAWRCPVILNNKTINGLADFVVIGRSEIKVCVPFVKFIGRAMQKKKKKKKKKKKAFEITHQSAHLLNQIKAVCVHFQKHCMLHVGSSESKDPFLLSIDAQCDLFSILNILESILALLDVILKAIDTLSRDTTRSTLFLSPFERILL